jgi:phosphoribosylamine--glycine ligase
MRAASIPTAESRAFTDPEAARQYVETRAQDEEALTNLYLAASRHRDAADRRKVIDEARRTDRAVASAYARDIADLPVIKAAGLAKGKGVILPRTLAEAVAAIDQIMVRRIFGDAGKEVVIEERLTGAEVSVLALVDGRNIYILETAQDHKRLNDKDEGPNTGGMGAFSPSDTIDDALMDRVQRHVLVPTVDALKRDGIDFRGVLYAGLMLTPAGPKVLEFNCRFGDPECQALMVRLETDLLETMLATCQGRLGEVELRWRDGASCCIVLAAPGYPEEPKPGLVITGVEEAAKVEGVQIFHAGTKRDAEGRLVTSGGRVLNIAAVGRDLAEARERAYEAADQIHFDGKVMRRDIGAKATVARVRSR